MSANNPSKDELSKAGQKLQQDKTSKKELSKAGSTLQKGNKK